MRVVWTRPALTDLLAIFDYLNDLNPSAAVKVTRTIRLTANCLVIFPNRGRLVRGTEMREVTTKYPYLIRYRIDAEAVVVLRIRHTARQPTFP